MPNALLEELVDAGAPGAPDGRGARARAGQDRHAAPAHGARASRAPAGPSCPTPPRSTGFLADDRRRRPWSRPRAAATTARVSRVVRSADDVADWFAAAAAAVPLLAEERVPFTRELAVLVARRPSGEVRVWPVVESVQVGGVCSEVVAPAPDLRSRHGAGGDRARRRGGRGTGRHRRPRRRAVRGPGRRPGGTPRPSWSTSSRCARTTPATGPSTASVTSQFEQHLRAVLDLPLGETRAREPWSVMANVLGSAHADLAGRPRRR